MKTYADYLRENGATAEDITILDTAVGRKAYEAMTGRMEAITADAEKRVNDYKSEADKWYSDTILPKYTEMEKRAATSAANEARARALILASQDEGLKAVAKEMGFVQDPAAPPAAPVLPAGFDPSKYVTRENLKELSDSVGGGLAALQDMVAEHAQLFPDKRLSIKALRTEALASGKDLYSFWESKYGVQAARDAHEKAEKDAYETRLRKEGADAARTELASTYGNPDARPLSPSASPFTMRPERARDKQPWEMGDQSAARVQQATKAVMDKISGAKAAN